MFNLGYLPGGDHAIVTKPEITVSAIVQTYRLLRMGSLISVLCYRGHVGGMEESLAVIDYAKLRVGALRFGR